MWRDLYGREPRLDARRGSTFKRVWPRLVLAILVSLLAGCGDEARDPQAGSPAAQSTVAATARPASTPTLIAEPTTPIPGQANVASPTTTTRADSSATSTASTPGDLLFSAAQGSNLPYMLQTVAADGTNLRQIAPDIRGSRPHKPVHSPDGQEIVFVHAPSRDSAEQLWIMAADGTNPHVLVDDFDGNEPAWSPDGQQIAFVSDPGPGNGDIYVVERDGAELRQLTSDERDDHAPVWSPDGQQIAVMAFAGVGPIQELHVMAADGSNVRKLATNPQPFDNNRPVWSPDGGQIAFLVSDPNDRTQVWVVNADGSNPRMLTDDPRLDDIHQDEWPGPPSIAWSPDGQWIAFSTVRDGNAEIYLMHPDGTGQRNLTNDPTRDDFGPVWSPGSTQIAFVSRPVNIPSDDFDALNRWSIHVMDTDGSNLQTVVDPAVGIVGNLGYEFQPPVSWRDEG